MASTCVSAAQAAIQVVHYTGTSWMCCGEGASPLCIQSTVLGRCKSPYNRFTQCVHIDQTTACGIDDSPPCGAYTGPYGAYGVQFYHDNHLASLNLTNVGEVVLFNWPSLGHDNSIALCCGAVCRLELVQYNDIDVCNNGEYMLKCAGDDLHGICSIWNNTETGEYLLVNANPGASFQADTPPPTFPVQTPEFSSAPVIGAVIAVMVILVFIFWRRWRGLQKGRSQLLLDGSSILQEVDGDTFQTIQRKFAGAWTPPGRNPPQCPAIMRIFSITHSPASAARFQNYCQTIGGSVIETWHGTNRQCSVGDNGAASICRSSSCKLCRIIEGSFDVTHATSTAAFGRGIYTSTASNKAAKWPQDTSVNRALLLSQAAVGNPRIVTRYGQVKTPGRGFHSVQFNGGIGRNETVLYDNDAIRPTYLVIYYQAG